MALSPDPCPAVAGECSPSWSLLARSPRAMLVPNVQAGPPGYPMIDPFSGDRACPTSTTVPLRSRRPPPSRRPSPHSARRSDGTASGRRSRWSTMVATSAPPVWMERARWRRRGVGWPSTRAIFGGDETWAAGLELVQDQELAGGNAGHAVLFRQVFGTLQSRRGRPGDGRRSRATRSSTCPPRSRRPPSRRRLRSSPSADAWRKASANVGRPVSPRRDPRDSPSSPRPGGPCSPSTASRRSSAAACARLPLRNGTVRPGVRGQRRRRAGRQRPARTRRSSTPSQAQVRVRHNQVDSLTDAEPQSEYSAPFQGVITATECGPRHPFEVDALTKTIIVAAGEVQTANDIVLNAVRAGRHPARRAATPARSPEAVTYAPAGGRAGGGVRGRGLPVRRAHRTVRTEPGDYVGVFIASEQEPPDVELAYPPMWDYFVANPALDFDSGGHHRQPPHRVLGHRGRRRPGRGLRQPALSR